MDPDLNTVEYTVDQHRANTQAAAAGQPLPYPDIPFGPNSGEGGEGGEGGVTPPTAPPDPDSWTEGSVSLTADLLKDDTTLSLSGAGAVTAVAGSVLMLRNGDEYVIVTDATDFVHPVVTRGAFGTRARFWPLNQSLTVFGEGEKPTGEPSEVGVCSGGLTWDADNIILRLVEPSLTAVAGCDVSINDGVHGLEWMRVVDVTDPLALKVGRAIYQTGRLAHDSQAEVCIYGQPTKSNPHRKKS